MIFLITSCLKETHSSQTSLNLYFFNQHTEAFDTRVKINNIPLFWHRLVCIFVTDSVYSLAQQICDTLCSMVLLDDTCSTCNIYCIMLPYVLFYLNALQLHFAPPTYASIIHNKHDAFISHS